jgi:DNA-binding transcriptional LysR family regulator
MLDWNDLKYVLALRDGGTMKQAAVLLKTDPTTVSRHVKRISTLLNADLFRMMKGGNWVLTPRGVEVTILAQKFKENLDQLYSRNGEVEESETINVTSLEFILTHYIAPHLSAGLACFPDTKITLIGSDKRLSLAYGEVDIALRFGRPTEGQLLTSKIADVCFEMFATPDVTPTDWIGMQPDLDWTPEMRLGHEHFGKPPVVRVSSFAAAREAAAATGLAAIGPCVIMRNGSPLVKIPNSPEVEREVWSIIHETRRHSQRLSAVREWIKNAVLETQSLQRQNALEKN